MPVLKVKKDGMWTDIGGSSAASSVSTDKTLTRYGQAADAKTVGDALTNKQDIILGKTGEFVVIDDNGNATTNDVDTVRANLGVENVMFWEEKNFEAPYNILARSLIYENGLYLAFFQFSHQEFLYSTDGTNWNIGTMPSKRAWYSIAYGNGKFVAVAYETSVIAHSVDGINWEEVDALPESAYWGSVTYGNGKFVAVADGNARSAYSTDGINWTSSNMPSGNHRWNTVKYLKDKFIATSLLDVPAYSTDGINWYSTSGNITLCDIEYGNNKFIGISLSSSIRYSTDGINWNMSSVSADKFSAIQHLIYVDNKFIGVGRTNVNDGYGTMVPHWVIAYSTDGTTWNTIVSTDNKLMALSGGNLIYDGNKFIATSQNLFAYSKDGMTWKCTYGAFTQNDVNVTDGVVKALSENGIAVGSHWKDGEDEWVLLTDGTMFAGETMTIQQKTTYTYTGTLSAYLDNSTILRVTWSGTDENGNVWTGVAEDNIGVLKTMYVCKDWYDMPIYIKTFSSNTLSVLLTGDYNDSSAPKSFIGSITIEVVCGDAEYHPLYEKYIPDSIHNKIAKFVSIPNPTINSTDLTTLRLDYVKIGRLVHVEMCFQNNKSSTNGSSITLYIPELPKMSGNNAMNGSFTAMMSETNSASWTIGTTTMINMYSHGYYNPGVYFSGIKTGSMNTNEYIRISATYISES